MVRDTCSDRIISGLSLSFCVSDILRGLIDLKYVKAIHPNFEWTGKPPASYYLGYWRDFRKEDINNLLASIKIEEVYKYTNIANGCWLKGTATVERCQDTHDRLTTEKDIVTIEEWEKSFNSWTYPLRKIIFRS